MATAYNIGDRPVVTATFRDVDDVLASPTTVVFITRTPAGVETVYTSPHAAITTPSTGVFKFTFPTPFTLAGTWYVRAKGTVGVETAVETSFRVKASSFTTP